jgi:3'-phosphoadenosine 5'-phosphosulfate sulfotransferase (PAPS reductase)/FAD synthetase
VIFVTPIERETFLLHSELDDYQSRIAAAKSILVESIGRSSKPYIAYSGGKDSLAMLHMALQASPKILVWHWDYGPYYIPRYIEAEIIRNAKAVGAKNITIDTSPKYNQGRCGQNVLFPALFGKVQPRMFKDGYDMVMVGLRAEESRRRKAKTTGGFKAGKINECYPVYQLTARDIWAYIVSHNLPYCGHYDRYGGLLGIEKVRMATFFDPEFDKLGASNLDGVMMPEFKHDCAEIECSRKIDYKY